MTQTLDAGLPPGIDLDSSYIIRFTAVDPTTGLVVSGVSVSNASLLVDNLGGGDLSGGFAVGEIEWLHFEDNLFAPEDGG